MARVPDELKERIKREISIQRLAEARGIKLTRSGKELIGLCPFHDDRNPSLNIDPVKNVWHCKGACGEGGDVIRWVERAEGVSYTHAVELLRRDYFPLAAGPVQPVKQSTVRKLPSLIDATADDKKLLGVVVDYYNQTLKQSPEAMRYLVKRGLQSGELIEHFRLGFANRTLCLHLPASNRVEGDAQRTRLKEIGILRNQKPGHEHFNGSLVIPVFNLAGEVVEMYGRKITPNLREGTPDHTYLPGPHRGVWNEAALQASREIILCEALIDAMTFWCAGFRNVTASYGVNGFTEDHRRAIEKHGTERVYIAYDRDEAGDKAGLDTNGTPGATWFYDVSANYFDVLRVRPALGRFFHAQDAHGLNNMPYIVLSYAYWETHFNGDTGKVGHAVRMNGSAYTILGVAPKGFRGSELLFAPDFWAPVVNTESTGFLTGRAARGLWVVGHLRTGVTASQATADLNGIAAYLAKTYPQADGGMRFGLTKPGLVGDMLGRPVRAFVSALMLLSGLILLAACANLGSLFSARAADRWREVALRLALGATRFRILRQLLTEAVLVATGGALLGIAGAVALLRALSAWQPTPDLPVNVPVHPDARTYLVAVGLALVSGLLFGIVPMRQVMRANPYQGIKAGSAGSVDMRRVTLRDVLLALQITVCTVLVTASLVALRGMVRSLHSNFGFDPHNTMQVNTDLGMAGIKGDQIPAMQRKLLDAIKGIPGVTAAGYADRIPLNIGWSADTVFRDSTTDYRPANRATDAMEYFVSPGYFRAARTRMLEGRTFTWDDKKSAPMTAVVNVEFARVLFGSDRNAVGRWFKIWGGKRVEVVGICEDGKYVALSEDAKPAMFLSILLSPSGDTWFLVRSNRGNDQLGPALERTLNELNTGLPFTINTWDRELGAALFAARAASMALGVLGGLGAMLAVTGIFGLGAYTVSKRLREFGIRIALGAPRRQVLHAALGRVFRLLALGSATGLLLGVAATRLLSYIVYQATPGDPVVLGGAVLTMLILGLVSAWIPAQRALGADPLILLREE